MIQKVKWRNIMLMCLFVRMSGKSGMYLNNNNNNNNKHDNVYGAVIMAEPLQEFTRFI